MFCLGGHNAVAECSEAMRAIDQPLGQPISHSTNVADSRRCIECGRESCIVADDRCPLPRVAWSRRPLGRERGTSATLTTPGRRLFAARFSQFIFSPVSFQSLVVGVGHADAIAWKASACPSRFRNGLVLSPLE